MLIIEFKPKLDAVEINDAIDRIRETVKARYQLMKYIIIQPDILDDNLPRDPNRGAHEMGI